MEGQDELNVPKYILNGELISKEDAKLLSNSPFFIDKYNKGETSLIIEGDDELNSSFLRNINNKNYSESFYQPSSSGNYGINDKNNLRGSDITFDLTQMAYANTMSSGIIKDDEFNTGVTSVDDLDDRSVMDEIFAWLQNPGQENDKLLVKGRDEVKGIPGAKMFNAGIKAIESEYGINQDILLTASLDKNGQPILEAIPYDKSVKKGVNTLSVYGIKDDNQNVFGIALQNFTGVMAKTDNSMIYLADAVGDLTYDYMLDDPYKKTALDRVADGLYQDESTKRIDNPEEAGTLFSSEWWASGIGSGAASLLQYAATGQGAGAFFRLAGLGARTSVGLGMFSAGMSMNTAESYVTAKEYGLDEKDTAKLALSTGFIKTAIELALFPSLEMKLAGMETNKAIADIILKETGGKITKESLKSAEKGIFKKSLNTINSLVKAGSKTSNFAIEGFKEGLEEFSQTYTDVIGQIAYDYFSDEKKFYTSADSHSFKEALGAGAIGFIMGAGASRFGNGPSTSEKDMSVTNMVIQEGAKPVLASIKVLEKSGQITPQKADFLRNKVNNLDSIIKANRNMVNSVSKKYKGDKIHNAMLGLMISNIEELDKKKNELAKLQDVDIQKGEKETDTNYQQRLNEHNRKIVAKESQISLIEGLIDEVVDDQKLIYKPDFLSKLLLPKNSIKDVKRNDKNVSELYSSILKSSNLSTVMNMPIGLDNKLAILSTHYNGIETGIMLLQHIKEDSELLNDKYFDNQRSLFERIKNAKTQEDKDSIIIDINNDKSIYYHQKVALKIAAAYSIGNLDLNEELDNNRENYKKQVELVKEAEKKQEEELKEELKNATTKTEYDSAEEKAKNSGKEQEFKKAEKEKVKEEEPIIASDAKEEGEDEPVNITEEETEEATPDDTESKEEKAVKRAFNNRFVPFKNLIINSAIIADRIEEAVLNSVESVEDFIRKIKDRLDFRDVLRDVLSIIKTNNVNTETDEPVIVEADVEFKEPEEHDKTFTNVSSTNLLRLVIPGKQIEKMFFDYTPLMNGKYKDVTVTIEQDELAEEIKEYIFKMQERESYKGKKYREYYDKVKNGVMTVSVYQNGKRYVIGLLMGSDNIYNPNSKELQSLREYIAAGNKVEATINKVTTEYFTGRGSKNSLSKVNTFGSPLILGYNNRTSSGGLYISVPNMPEVEASIVNRNDEPDKSKAGQIYVILPNADGKTYTAHTVFPVKLSEAPALLEEAQRILSTYNGSNFADVQRQFESITNSRLREKDGILFFGIGDKLVKVEGFDLGNLWASVSRKEMNRGTFNKDTANLGGLTVNLAVTNIVRVSSTLNPITKSDDVIETIVDKNAKYNAELAALEQQEAKTQQKETEVRGETDKVEKAKEAKKADIERRRQEELDNKQKFVSSKKRQERKEGNYKEISVEDIDLEASNLEDIPNDAKVIVLEERGLNRDGQKVGTVRIVTKEGAGTFEVVFNTDKINAKYDAELNALEQQTEQKDSVHEQDKDSKDDGFIDEDFDTAFSIKEDYNPIYWNKEKELKYIQDKLGTSQEVVVNTQLLLDVAKEYGHEAWGMVRNAVIYLRENSKAGTGYHEAFHIVFRYLLNDAQQSELLKLNTEEEMANMFSDYKLDTQMSLPSKIKNFFKKLYYIVSELFSPNKILSLDHLFSKIDRGQFKDKTKMNVDRFKDDAYSLIKVGGLNPLQIKQRVATINAKAFKIYEETLKNNKELGGLNFVEFINIVSPEQGMQEIYKKVYNSLRQDLKNTTDPKVQDGIRLMLTNLFRKEGDKIVKGKLYELAVRDLQNYGINARIDNMSEVSDIIDENISEGAIEENENEQQIGGWTVSNLQIDPRKTISVITRRKLQSIPKYDPNEPDNVKKDELGYPEYADAGDLFNYLIRHLSNSTKTSSIKKKLKELSKYKPEINFLISELNSDDTFASAFYSNMKKASATYISIIKNKEGKIVRINPNKSDISSILESSWESAVFSKLFNIKGEVTENGKEIAKEVAKNLREIFKTVQQDVRNNTALITDQKFGADVLKLIGKELQKIGIDINLIEPEMVTADNTIASISTTLIGPGETFVTISELLSEGKNPFRGDSRTSKALKSITKLFNNAYVYLVQPSFSNMEGESMYSYVMFNYLFKIREQIKENVTEFVSSLKRDSFYKHMPLLTMLQNMGKKELADFDIAIFDGININNRARYTSMSPSQLIEASLHAYNNNGASNGWFRFPTLSDKPNMVFVSLPKLDMSAIYKGLFEVYKAELTRINSEPIGNSQFDTRKGLFHLLPYLNKLSKKDKARLSNYVYFEQVTRDALEEAWANENQRIINNNVETGKMTSEEIKRWFFNSLFYNTQLISIFSGDPAFFKNEGDFQKRNAQVWSPVLIGDDEAIFVDVNGDMHFVPAFYNTVYVDDVKYNADKVFDHLLKTFVNVLGYSESKAKELLAPYKSIEATDGQGFITLKRYRDIRIQFGEWGNAQEDIYNRLQKGEYNKEDVAIIFQTIKPFMFTKIWDEDSKKYIPTQHKNSEMVLLPQIAYAKDADGNYINPELANALSYMTDNEVDALQFKTVVKVGARELHNWNELGKGSIHKISSLEYGIQQNVPEHHVDHKNLFAVQARKIIISDLPKEGWPDEVTREKVFTEVQDILSSVVEDGADILENALLDGDGINMELLQRLIKNEVANRNMGIYAEYATNIINDKFVVPLFNPQTATKTQQLVSSIMRNRVTKIKAPGPTLVQASSVGLTNMLNVVYNKEGGIDYYEALLPWWTKSMFPVKEDGTVDWDKVEHPDDLLGIAYRIPTEDKYSIIPIRPIGFLPPSAPGAIMLPHAVIAQTGSDFDVDKLFLITKSVFVNKKGKIESYKYNTDPTQSRGRYKNYILSKIRKEMDKDMYSDFNETVWQPLKLSRDSNYIKFKSAWKDRRKQIGEESRKEFKDKATSGQLASIIRYRTQEEYETVWIPKLNEINDKLYDQAVDKISTKAKELGLLSFEEFEKLPIERQNSQEARFNRVIDIIKMVYANPYVLDQATVPGGFEPLIKIATKIRRLEKKSLDLPLFLPSTQDEFTIRNITGADLIGSAANSKSNHALLQRFQMEFRNPISFMEDGKIQSYSKISNVDNDEKTVAMSRIIANILAASVDNAKEPIAEDLNLNQLTLDVWAAIVRVGYGLDTATYFTAQPVLKELVKRWRNYGADVKAYNRAKTELFDELSSFATKEVETYSAIQFQEMIGSRNYSTQSQYHILSLFDRIKEEAGEPLTKLILAMKYDVSGVGKTVADTEVIIENVNETLSDNNEYIKGADIMSYPIDTYKSMITFYEKGILLPYEIMNKIFPYEKPLFRAVKSSLKHLMNYNLSPDVINKANNFVVSKIFSNFAFFKDLDAKYYILEFPSVFTSMIKDPNSLLYMLKDKFISRLNTVNKESFNKLELINSMSMLGNERDNIKAVIDYILDEGNEQEVKMIHDLIKYSYITGGLTMSPNSVSSVIPETIFTRLTDDNKTLSDFLYDSVEAMSGSPIEIYDEFVMNNPTSSPEIDPDEDYISSYISNKTGIVGALINRTNKRFYNKELGFVPHVHIKNEDGSVTLLTHTFNGRYIISDKKGLSGITELHNDRSVFKQNITNIIPSKVDDRLKRIKAINKDSKVIEANFEEDVIEVEDTKESIIEGVVFQEDLSSGYASRTKKNAAADVTFALAVDFTSAGEKLTKRLVKEQGKMYIPIDANKLEFDNTRVEKIVNALNKLEGTRVGNTITLNIAGNGIYTMKGKYTQEQVDGFTYKLLDAIINSPNLKVKIESIRTGGQTGFDEAGAKAGIKLGIPTTILAPKGWRYRPISGQDISSEKAFKERFKNILTKEQEEQLFQEEWEKELKRLSDDNKNRCD